MRDKGCPARTAIPESLNPGWASFTPPGELPHPLFTTDPRGAAVPVDEPVLVPFKGGVASPTRSTYVAYEYRYNRLNLPPPPGRVGPAGS